MIYLDMLALIKALSLMVLLATLLFCKLYEDCNLSYHVDKISSRSIFLHQVASHNDVIWRACCVNIFDEVTQTPVSLRFKIRHIIYTPVSLRHCHRCIQHCYTASLLHYPLTSYSAGHTGYMLQATVYILFVFNDDSGYSGSLFCYLRAVYKAQIF